MANCNLCERDTRLTRHHLIPRTRHSNLRKKKKLKKQDFNETIQVCSSCHKQIHALFSEKELAEQVNTLEKLRDKPELMEFVSWIASKPAEFKARVNKKKTCQVY